MGWGDAKLVALTGAVLGAPLGYFTLAIACARGRRRPPVRQPPGRTDRIRAVHRCLDRHGASPRPDALNIARVVLIFLGRPLPHLGPLRLPGDGDLYWQRWLGNVILHSHRLPNALGTETFTAAGASWVPQEWLFSIAVAAAHNRGAFVLFAGLVSLLPLGILLSIVARARGEAPSQAIGITLVFAGMALAESFGIRAQVAGWFCFAWLLYFVERRDAWRYAAIAVTLVWANVHASVMLAPLVIVGRMTGYALDRRWRDVVAQLPLLLGVALAICCTPLGMRLPQYALTLANGPIDTSLKNGSPASWAIRQYCSARCRSRWRSLRGRRCSRATSRKPSLPHCSSSRCSLPDATFRCLPLPPRRWPPPPWRCACRRSPACSAPPRSRIRRAAGNRGRVDLVGRHGSAQSSPCAVPASRRRNRGTCRATAMGIAFFAKTLPGAAWRCSIPIYASSSTDAAIRTRCPSGNATLTFCRTGGRAAPFWPATTWMP